MDLNKLPECVFGCVQEGGSSEAPNKKIKHGKCQKCGKHQRGKKCMHLVDDHGEDGYCNTDAVIKYSTKIADNGCPMRRCRLHYYMECCEEAEEIIDELEKELDELEQDLEEAEKKN